MNDENDYGFTIEYNTSKIQAELKSKETKLDKKIKDYEYQIKELKHELNDVIVKNNKLKEIVIPLLKNLAKDGDTKPVINWPNRDKILNEKIKEIESL